MGAENPKLSLLWLSDICPGCSSERAARPAQARELWRRRLRSTAFQGTRQRIDWVWGLAARQQPVHAGPCLGSRVKIGTSQQKCALESGELIFQSMSCVCKSRGSYYQKKGELVDAKPAKQ